MVPLHRTVDLAPYSANPDPRDRLLYLHAGVSLDGHPLVAAHLDRFRPVLMRARERRQGKIPWYSLHWPRDPRLFAGPKIVVPYRARRPAFVLDEDRLFALSSVNYLRPREGRDTPPLAALCALLNAGVTERWLRLAGRQKGDLLDLGLDVLEAIPVPSPGSEDPRWAELSALGQRRAHACAPEHADLEAEIDRLVADLHGVPGSWATP